jgi:hypothetical protein
VQEQSDDHVGAGMARRKLQKVNWLRKFIGRQVRLPLAGFANPCPGMNKRLDKD